MTKFVIKGGNRLYGTVNVRGAKNAVLPLMAASILTDGEIAIDNCPSLSDVDNMGKILNSLGVNCSKVGHVLTIDPSNVSSYSIPAELGKELRSSIFLLGSVLGRMKKARVSYPGGCDIGLRPIDIHLNCLRDLGVKIEEEHGYIFCDARDIHGGDVHMDYPSVGATENVILASVLTPGITTVYNPAREPEIVDLQNFLVSMGAKIKGAGSSVIRIEGVKRLSGTRYSTMPDRIVAGTIMSAVAMCGGDVTLTSVNSKHLKSLISKLKKTSCNIIEKSDIIRISQKSRPLSPIAIETQPYPGFPTDLQAEIMAVSAVADGTTLITENIFETRFKHVPELIKMKADIVVKGKTAIVRGVPRLIGAEVNAEDLRGGAALIIAGLSAEGTTVVNNIRYVDRGYEKIENLFRDLGGDIQRV